MNILKLIPAIISFLLLGAHFMRFGIMPVYIFFFLFPFILFVKKAWVVRVVQFLLLLGVIEWIRALFVYLQIRQMFGQDSSKLVIIMCSVALFTLFAALLFQTPSLKKLYKIT